LRIDVILRVDVLLV
jgi:hypothetical protein